MESQLKWPKKGRDQLPGSGFGEVSVFAESAYSQLSLRLAPSFGVCNALSVRLIESQLKCTKKGRDQLPGIRFGEVSVKGELTVFIPRVRVVYEVADSQ